MQGFVANLFHSAVCLDFRQEPDCGERRGRVRLPLAVLPHHRIPRRRLLRALRGLLPQGVQQEQGQGCREQNQRCNNQWHERKGALNAIYEHNGVCVSELK